jgi:hypothetical protein
MSWRTWLGERLAGDYFASQLAATETRLRAEGETRVREALSAGLGRTDDQKMAVEGFRRITAGGEVLRRDLLPLAQDQHNRLVSWLAESNPVAAWLIRTTVDFVLGEGVTVTSEDAQVQAALAQLWDDPVNRLGERMEDFTREYGLYGELILPAFVNDYDGSVRLGYIDPLEVDEILTDPDNVLITTAVKLKGPAGVTPRLYKVIREDTRRASSYFGRLMPALPMERGGGLTRTGAYVDGLYDGSCFLFQTNKASNARRGRSDLIDLIDWLDGYDQFMFDSMDSAAQLNSFLWDVKLDGMSETQIADWLTQQGTLRRGMIRAHNEKVTWAAVAPDLKAQDKDAYAKLLLSHMIGSKGYPLFMYGIGEGTGLVAKEMGQTPLKAMTRRQRRIRRMIETLCRFQCDQKIIRKLLPEQVLVGASVNADTGDSRGTLRPVREAIQIAMPEISSKDQSAIVAALTGLVPSLGEAQQLGWVRPETAAKLFAHLASQLGVEVSADEEYTPQSGPTDAQTGGYDPQRLSQLLARTRAQLSRAGLGNADNMLLPKGQPTGAS